MLAQAGAELAGCGFGAARGVAFYLGKLTVARRLRRQGVLHAMVDALATQARAAGLVRLELQTRIELEENHATFAALGFAEVARTAHPGYARPTSLTMARPV